MRARVRLRSRRLRSLLHAGAAMVLLAAVLVVVTGTAGQAASELLTRMPYLSDLSADGVTINWATSRASTGGVTWGRSGEESCTADRLSSSSSASVRSLSMTVNDGLEYQWRANLTGLTPDVVYCYRIFLATTDLLGTAVPAPAFRTAPAVGSFTSYSFSVVGDWGEVDSTGSNSHQANVLKQIAASGSRFVVFTGDLPYGSGAQTDYGDLTYSSSSVFGPEFWAKTGMGVPAFMTLGNHGMTLATFDNWPEARAASSSGGRYSFEAYPSINGSTRTKYPRAWYAFDVGAARFYILQAAWPSSNEANGTLYSNDYAFNWDPTSTSFGEEYRWLRDDLAVRPNQQKFAFFHFPLYSDHSDEPSDSYLQIDGPAGADSLEGLLSRAGVDIVFNGHAHIYERNIAQHGIVSYVTGGGGAELEDV